MKVIQELVAYFDRRGRLTRSQIRKLLDQGLLAADAPPTCSTCATRSAQPTTSASPARRPGSLWGTDVYTGDSALAVAAVHAGLVNAGETAVVKVTVEQPLAQYQGSVRNGVTSQDYGQYGTAYRMASV